MADVLTVRKADCGHFIPEGMKPVAQTTGDAFSPQPIYLCASCLESVRAQEQPRVERKDLGQEHPPHHAQPPEPLHVELAGEDHSDEWRAGWDAYFAGKSATENPHDGRKKAGREWSAGFAAAEEGQSREGDYS